MAIAQITSLTDMTVMCYALGERWISSSETPPLHHIPATGIPIHSSKVVLWYLCTELQTMIAEIL
jgi:hypothetical protein